MFTLFYGLLGSSNADQIRSAVAVQGPTPTGTYLWQRTIDQSGLSIAYLNGISDFDTYVNNSPVHTRTNSPPNYSASFEFSPITYDLGSNFSVNQLAIWNYPFGNSGGIRQFEVTTSLLADFSNAKFVGSFLAVDDGNDLTNFVQVFNLVDTITRYVRITRISGGPHGTGLAEVAFGVSAVPEPGSALCLLIGTFATVLGRPRLSKYCVDFQPRK